MKKLTLLELFVVAIAAFTVIMIGAPYFIVSLKPYSFWIDAVLFVINMINFVWLLKKIKEKE